jgi:hypothetical protein
MRHYNKTNKSWHVFYTIENFLPPPNSTVSIYKHVGPKIRWKFS